MRNFSFKALPFLCISCAFFILACSKHNEVKPQVLQVVVSTFAGSAASGHADGTGAAATFNVPSGVAIDSQGNLYVADGGNNLIRKITPAGVVTTVAGSGATGSDNGTGISASFNDPSSLAIDAAGNIYVADLLNRLIRKITPAGVVSTLAGNGSDKPVDGTGTAASFNIPTSIVVDAAGNVFVADYYNIRKITPAGVVSTFAGSGKAGSADGSGTAASFHQAEQIAIDASGNLYVSDSANNLIRKITPAGVVTTLAGTGAEGSADGSAKTASFNGPIGIAVDDQGNIFVGDSDFRIRVITPTGAVSTIAGTGTEGYEDGKGTQATFSIVYGIISDGKGNLFLGDTFNNVVRKIAY